MPYVGATPQAAVTSELKCSCIDSSINALPTVYFGRSFHLVRGYLKEKTEDVSL